MHRYSLVAVIALFVLPDLAHAQKVVRIIWDVGGATLHYRRSEEVATLNASLWEFPPRVGSGYQGFDVVTTNARPIGRGDLVRVYITNYNPVAHVPSAARLTALADDTPLIGALLAAVIKSLMAGTLPQITPGTGAGFGPLGIDISKLFEISPELDPNIDEWCNGYQGEKLALCSALQNAAREFANLKLATSTYVPLPERVHITAIARTLSAFPSRSFGVFDGPTAWNGLTTALEADAKVSVSQFRASVVAKALDVRKGMENIENTLVQFDISYANTILLPTGGKDEDLDRRRSQLGELLKRVSEALQGELDLVKNSSDLLTEIQKALDTANPCPPAGVVGVQNAQASLCHQESAYAAEVVATDDTRKSLLVIDLPFRPQDKEATQREYRYLVLQTENLPRFFTSLGIAYNQLNFKKLQLVQVPPAEGNELTKVLEVADDQDFRAITGSVLGHVGDGVPLGEFRVPLYFTFGTTPDKNVFRNWILGGSVYLPPIRSVITVGTLLAKGSSEEDIQAQKMRYDPYVSTVDVSKVPSVATWHSSFFVSLSVSIF